MKQHFLHRIFAVLILIAIGAWQNVNAQVANYSFTQSNTVYTPITGGTVLGDATSDDQRYVDPAIPLGGTITTGPGLPIGFSFTYNNTVFDVFAVNTNGWISFGQSALAPNAVDNNSSSGYTAISATSTAPANLQNRVAGFARDLQGQTGSELSYLTIGTAPNRILVVQWKDFKRYSTTGTGDLLNFQIRLYETTNIIEVVYGSYTVGTTSSTDVQVGLRGTSNADFNNRTTSTDWAATLRGTLNNNANTISQTVLPASGLTFSWAPPGPDDAATVGYASQPICPGLQPVIFTIANQGSNTIDFVTVDWSVNGVSQTPFLAGPGLALAPGASANVTVGNYTFASGTYNIMGSTSFPNGQVDLNTANDTLTVTLSTGLSGGYTINSGQATGGTNFQSFGDAASALNTLGICAAVTFDVVQGTYNEQILLNDIVGSSAVNTIIFRPDVGNTAPVILTFAATGTGDNFLIQFNGTKYTTVQGLTLNATGTTYGRVFVFSAANEAINILNNIVNGPLVAASSTNTALIYHNTGTANRANHVVVNGNTLTGGAYSAYIYGVSTTDYEIGNRFTNNTVMDYYSYGLYFYYQDSGVINNNTIKSRTTGAATTLYGIYNYYSDNSSVQKNIVVLNGTSTMYGIYTYYNDATAAGPSLVANNMVSCIGVAGTGTIYGLYTYNAYYQNIYHNSILVTGGTATAGRGLYINSSTTGTYGFVNIMNNNVVNTGGGYAMELSSGANTLGYVTAMNNNNWYATGATTVRFNNTNYATLAAYQVAVPAFDAASVSGDPLFSANDDLHVNAAVTNNVAATGLGIADDIDGDVRCPGGGCPGATSNPDIGADEFAPVSDNAYPIALITPTSGCGTASQNIQVTIGNLGLNTINSTNVTVNITGAMTNSITGTFSTNIPSGSFDTLIVGNINTSDGGIFNFEIITQLTGDADNTNDTLWATISIESSNTPVAINDTVCSGNTATLSASPDALGRGFAWYDAASGGNLVATGSTFTTPVLSGDTTFYAENIGGTDSLMTTFAAGNGCAGGNMFNITAISNLSITGLAVNPSASTTVNIYYIANSTYLGNETTAAAWTLLGSVAGISTTASFSIPTLSIPAGQTYAIYIEYDASYTSLATTYSNANMTITTGAGLCSSFGGVNAGRTFNGVVYYQGVPCNTTRIPVTAVVNPSVTASAAVTDATCTASDGTATASETGGTAPFSYVWSSGATTATISGLAAGSYDVTVTDVNGCESTASAAVTATTGNLTAAAATTDATCTASDGTATASETGGTAPFGYVWSNGETTAAISGLAVGSYDVTITDANGCESTANAAVTATAGNLSASAAATDAICTASNGTATASETGGTAPFGYVWSNGETTAAISGLAVGSYDVTISDANGCESTASAAVTATAGNLASTSVATDATVNGASDGAIDLTVIGGTAPFTFLWSNGAITEDISGLTAGTYSVTVTDANGCASTTSATVNQPPVAVVNTQSSISVAIYPNPTESLTTIDLQLANAADIEIRLVTLAGQILQSFELTQVQNVKHILNVADLPAAVYMVQIVSGADVITRRLVVTNR